MEEDPTLGPLFEAIRAHGVYELTAACHYFSSDADARQRFATFMNEVSLMYTEAEEARRRHGGGTGELRRRQLAPDNAAQAPAGGAAPGGRRLQGPGNDNCLYSKDGACDETAPGGTFRRGSHCHSAS